MNTRRGFFTSLAKAAAIVALAPQLCFKQKWEAPEIVLSFRANTMGVYEQLRMCDEVCDRTEGGLDLPELFRTVYAIKKRREQNQEWVGRFFREDRFNELT